jgi:hypothetical protein
MTILKNNDNNNNNNNNVIPHSSFLIPHSSFLFYLIENKIRGYVSGDRVGQ